MGFLDGETDLYRGLGFGACEGLVWCVIANLLEFGSCATNIATNLRNLGFQGLWLGSSIGFFKFGIPFWVSVVKNLLRVHSPYSGLRALGLHI